MVSPSAESLSKIGDIITILYSWASLDKNIVVGPVSASSANSHQGYFSLVQNANGIAIIMQVDYYIIFMDIINIKKLAFSYSMLPGDIKY